MKWVKVVALLIFVVGLLFVFNKFGEIAAGLLGFLGLGGAGVVRGVKKRAQKKHDTIAGDPDAVQSDNLDRLRRRDKKRKNKRR